MSSPIPSLSYGQHVVAFLHVLGLGGTRGPASGLLTLRVRATTHATGPLDEHRAVIPLMVGTVAAEGMGFIGMIQPRCERLHCLSQNYPQDFDLNAEVSFGALEAIDRLRDTGPVKLRWMLQAQVAGFDQIWPQDAIKTSSTVLEHIVEGDRWNTLLAQLGYEERMYVDGYTAVGGPSFPSAFTKAGSFVKLAIMCHRNRDWSGTAVRCRDALEEIDRVTGQSPLPLTNARDQQLTMDDRLVYVAGAVRHATHVGAHGAAGEVSQHQARVILDATMGLLRYHCRVIPTSLS